MSSDFHAAMQRQRGFLVAEAVHLSRFRNLRPKRHRAGFYGGAVLVVNVVAFL